MNIFTFIKINFSEPTKKRGNISHQTESSGSHHPLKKLAGKIWGLKGTRFSRRVYFLYTSKCWHEIPDVLFNRFFFSLSQMPYVLYGWFLPTWKVKKWPHSGRNVDKYFHPMEHLGVYFRSTPHPITVTTRIITFLVGNPYKPSFATVTGWGVDPMYIGVP